MKLKFYSLVAFSAATAFMMLSIRPASSNQLQFVPGRSGDPKTNLTCSTTGCHQNLGAAQDGAAIFDLRFSNTNVTSSTLYVPGQQYTAAILIKTPTNATQKYGFSLSALTASNSNAGIIDRTNSTNTDTVSFNGVRYIGHVDAKNNIKSWAFRWTAPAASAGPVTFYATVNLANGNGNETGDTIYKRVITINPDGSVGMKEVSAIEGLQLYPNPVSSSLNISYSLMENARVEAALVSVEGKLVKSFDAEEKSTGNHTAVYNVQEIPAGNYLLRINANGKSVVKHVFKI
jgi:hypothetical protein